MSSTIHFGIPNYSLTSNKINRLKYGVHLVPLITIIRYFSSYENIYFLSLAIFQLLTLGVFPSTWSPTGPYSTAVPLALCVLMEIISDVVKWTNIWYHDKHENEKVFKCLDPDGNLSEISNKNLHPGHVIFLLRDEISPVDGTLVGTINDDYAKINMALLTGESNIRHITEIKKNYLLKDYTNHTLTNDNGNFYLDGFHKLNKNNLVMAGSIIKSDGVYLWVTACGNDKSNNLSKNISLTNKQSTIDRFVGRYMMCVNVPILVLLVLGISTIRTMNCDDKIVISYFIYCIQNWILFNGIIPFSVKIFIILARNCESYFCSGNTLTINNPNQIDDFGKIKKIVCDKTGTVTKNELEFTKLVQVGSNNIMDVISFSSETQTISDKFYKCLGICIHKTENDFATVEDKIIRNGYESIGVYCTENDSEITLFYCNHKHKFNYVMTNGLEFTHERKMSSRIVRDKKNRHYIYSKGALDKIYEKTTIHGKQELSRLEHLISQKYPELRLLAFAYRKLDPNEIQNMEKEDIDFSIMEKDLTFLGIIGIRDVLQPNVKDTIRQISSYGITTSLCTGDRKITAVAVAQEIGISDNNKLVDYDHSTVVDELHDKTLVFSGKQVETLKEMDHFRNCLVHCENFIGCYMSPMDKKMTVKLLEMANINTMSVGDGFNDLGMFNSSSFSVAIKGNDFIETSADYSIKQFSELAKLFKIGMECYDKNTRLINSTFYRCSVVIFSIVAYCLLFPSVNYQSPYNGFVIQAFNFAWTIIPLCYLILRRIEPNIDFAHLKRNANSSFVRTSISNIMGIMDGLMIVTIFYRHGFGIKGSFNDILALAVIIFINGRFSKQMNINGIEKIVSIFGIFLFIIYTIIVDSFGDIVMAFMTSSLTFYFEIILYDIFMICVSHLL